VVDCSLSFFFLSFYFLLDTHSDTDCSRSRCSRFIVIPAKARFARGCNFYILQSPLSFWYNGTVNAEAFFDLTK
jgi:hypothetical protein